MFKGIPLGEQVGTEVLCGSIPTHAVLTPSCEGVHVDPMRGTELTLTWRALEVILAMPAVQEALAKRTGRELT